MLPVEAMDLHRMCFDVDIVWLNLYCCCHNDYRCVCKSYQNVYRRDSYLVSYRNYCYNRYVVDDVGFCPPDCDLYWCSSRLRLSCDRISVSMMMEETGAEAMAIVCTYLGGSYGFYNYDLCRDLDSGSCFYSCSYYLYMRMICCLKQ